MRTYDLYDLMLEYIKHSCFCQDCGDKIWTAYSDGHVWDKCLNCDEPTKTKDHSHLDIAGYITDFPVPQRPLPDCIEVREFDPKPPWSKTGQ